MTKAWFPFVYFRKAGARSKALFAGKVDEHEEIELPESSSQSKPLDDTWNNIQKAKQEQQQEEKTIHLERLLVDAYEYHSLASLGMYFLWYAAFACFIFTQESASSATFKNSIVQSLTGWDTGNPWESVTLDSVDSLEDGFNYTIGYMQSRVNFSNYAVGPEGFSQNVIYLSQFAQLSFAQVVIDFETNCYNAYRVRRPPGIPPKNRMPRCYRDLGNLPTNVTPADGDKIDPDYWDFSSKFEFNRDRVVGIYRIPLAAITQTRDAVYSALNALDVGSYYRAVAKYGGSIALEMLAVNRLGRGSAVVKLRFRVASPAGGQKLLQEIAVYTVRNRYTFFEILFAILFLAGTVCFIVEEFWHRQLYYWQTGSSWGGYFSSKWNVWYNACYISNFIWISFWAGLLYQKETDYWLDHTAFSLVAQRAENYTQWLYCGDIIMIFIGVCMCRFMRVHRGLGVFYSMLISSFRSIMDFAVFVVYVLVVFGSAVFVFFKVSGGNSQFLTWTDSISLISRLGFGFLDYYGFSNKGLGLGQYTALATLVFWLAVIFLVVFVQNILLAIFSNAYDAERNNALEAEYSFLVLVFKRTFFAVRWLLPYQAKRWMWPQTAVVPLAQRILGDEYNKDPEELYGMKKTARLRNSIRRHTTAALRQVLTESSRKLAIDGSLNVSRLGISIGHADSMGSNTGAPPSEVQRTHAYGDPINYERLHQRYMMARYAVVQANDMRDLARYFTNFRTRKIMEKGRMNWKLLEELEVARKNDLSETYIAKIPNREDTISERELAYLLAHVRKHREMLSFRTWFSGIFSRVMPCWLKYYRAPYYTKDESLSAAMSEKATAAITTPPEPEPSPHVTIEILPTIPSKAELPALRRTASLPHVTEDVEQLVQNVVGVYAYVHRLKRGQPTTQQKPDQSALMDRVKGLESQLSHITQLLHEMKFNSRALTRQATRNPSTLGTNRSLLGSI